MEAVAEKPATKAATGMKFTITVNAFLEALGVAKKAMQGKVTLPILRCALIEQRGADGIIVTGTNLELVLQREVTAMHNDTGQSSATSEIMNTNPLFDNLNESTPVNPFLEALGFDVEIVVHDYDELPDPEEVDWEEVFNSWQPEAPGGYEFAAKCEHEHHGLIAFFVMPTTPFAEAVWGLATNFETHPNVA